MTDTTVVTYYIDAVAAFDTRTGELRKLLAPQRSDSTMFAARGDLAVTPRCDGVLVVHRNGCQVRELTGHRMPAGVRPAESFQGMHFVDDTTLVSLGADGTLRRWDADRGAELTSKDVPGGAVGVRLLAQPGTGTLLLSRPDAVVALNSDTLEPQERWGPFPPTAGWMPLGEKMFAGITADPERKGVLLRQNGGDAEEFIDTHDAPESMAVSDDGALAVVVGLTFFYRPASGKLRRTELEEPLYQVTASEFSPDGALLFAQDARRGVHIYDVATGKRRAVLEGPV